MLHYHETNCTYVLFHLPHSCFRVFLILLSDRYENQYAGQIKGHLPYCKSHRNMMYQKLPLVWDSNLGHSCLGLEWLSPLSRVCEISSTCGVWLWPANGVRGLHWGDCFQPPTLCPSSFLLLVHMEWSFAGCPSILHHGNVISN